MNLDDFNDRTKSIRSRTLVNCLLIYNNTFIEKKYPHIPRTRVEPGLKIIQSELSIDKTSAESYLKAIGIIREEFVKSEINSKNLEIEELKRRIDILESSIKNRDTSTLSLKSDKLNELYKKIPSLISLQVIQRTNRSSEREALIGSLSRAFLKIVKEVSNCGSDFTSKDCAELLSEIRTAMISD